jgi:hypothetical protein
MLQRTGLGRLHTPARLTRTQTRWNRIIAYGTAVAWAVTWRPTS